jgi:hypothetical protein
MEMNILEVDSKIKKFENRLLETAGADVLEQAVALTTWFVRKIARARPPDDAYSFYLIETSHILCCYEAELKKPVPIQFRRRPAVESDVERLAKQYLYILSRLASRFDFLAVENGYRGDVEPVRCACVKAEYILEENDFFACCRDCGERFELGNVATNYGDSKRLILSQKNPHDKRHHFSECIDKFQGIQKHDFPPTFFSDIEKQLQMYNLLDAGAPTRAGRFERVKKDHIKLILKNMDLYKAYKEEINVIYKMLTDKPLPQIEHLKGRLLADFVVFDEQYNQLFSKTGKTAYHYYLILYQLLCSYGVACDKADFNFLKTAERKSLHDQKYKQVFEAVGWNYTPLF